MTHIGTTNYKIHFAKFVWSINNVCITTLSILIDLSRIAVYRYEIVYH